MITPEQKLNAIAQSPKSLGQMAEAMTQHELTRAKNVGHWHYAFRNHSALFRCPVCGKEQRRNTNFLGNRFHLECDGQKFHRVAHR